MGNNINIKLIENYIKEKNLTKIKFCKICKISLGTLNKIMTNNKNFSIVTLFKIAKILNIQIYQLFI